MNDNLCRIRGLTSLGEYSRFLEPQQESGAAEYEAAIAEFVEANDEYAKANEELAHENEELKAALESQPKGGSKLKYFLCVVIGLLLSVIMETPVTIAVALVGGYLIAKVVKK